MLAAIPACVQLAQTFAINLSLTILAQQNNGAFRRKVTVPDRVAYLSFRHVVHSQHFLRPPTGCAKSELCLGKLPNGDYLARRALRLGCILVQ